MKATDRIYIALDSKGRVVTLKVRLPSLVPADAVELSFREVKAAPALDPRRAGLFLLGRDVEREPGLYGRYPYITDEGETDSHGRRPALTEAISAADHHLLVFEEHEPAAELRAAIAAGRLEALEPQVYLTREPIPLAEAQAFAREATLLCGFAGRETSLLVEASAHYEQDLQNGLREDYLRYETHAGVSVDALPPEFQEALRPSLHLLDELGERARLEEMCDAVRAVDAEGEPAADVEAVARFQDRRAPAARASAWPSGYARVSFVGSQVRVPPDAAGKTMLFRRQLASPALFYLAGSLGVVAYLLYATLIPVMGPLVFGIAFAMMFAVGVVVLQNPHAILVSDKDTVYSSWFGERRLSFEDALKRPPMFRRLLEIRKQARDTDASPPCVAVFERLTIVHRAHDLGSTETFEDWRSHADRPPAYNVFRVGERVELLNTEIWRVATLPTRWQLDCDALRAATEGCAVVLAPCAYDPTSKYEPIYAAPSAITELTLLAHADDDAEDLRRAFVAAGGEPWVAG